MYRYARPIFEVQLYQDVVRSFAPDWTPPGEAVGAKEALMCFCELGLMAKAFVHQIHEVGANFAFIDYVAAAVQRLSTSLPALKPHQLAKRRRRRKVASPARVWQKGQMKVECKCGGSYRIKHKAWHFTTLKHRRWAEKNKHVSALLGRKLGQTRMSQREGERKSEGERYWEIRMKLRWRGRRYKLLAVSSFSPPSRTRLAPT